MCIWFWGWFFLAQLLLEINNSLFFPREIQNQILKSRLYS